MYFQVLKTDVMNKNLLYWCNLILGILWHSTIFGSYNYVKVNSSLNSFRIPFLSNRKLLLGFETDQVWVWSFSASAAGAATLCWT